MPTNSNALQHVSLILIAIGLSPFLRRFGDTTPGGVVLPGSSARRVSQGLGRGVMHEALRLVRSVAQQSSLTRAIRRYGRSSELQPE